jgi:hypothetical protein
MNFLLDLNVIIGYTVKRSNLIYETVSDIGGLEDPTIKQVRHSPFSIHHSQSGLMKSQQDLLEKALDMRTRFVFASRASDVYNAVSNQYILPALDKLPQLQLLGRTSKEVIGAKMDELHDMRSQACSGTEALATQVRIPFMNYFGMESVALTNSQMHRDLKATLTGLIRAPALTVEGIIEEDEDEDTAT